MFPTGLRDLHGTPFTGGEHHSGQAGIKKGISLQSVLSLPSKEEKELFYTSPSWA